MLLTNDFDEEAGRAAYLAGLHAALAYIVLTTATHVKTHRGARSRFAQLLQQEKRLDPTFASFLGRAYELKDRADYDQIMLVHASDAEDALTEAARMVDAVAALVPA